MSDQDGSDELGRQEFSPSRDGFDRDEVHTYLQSMDAQYRDLLVRSQDATARLEQAEHELEQLRENQHGSVDTVIMAVIEARDRILEQAHQRAREIAEEARSTTASSDHDPGEILDASSVPTSDSGADGSPHGPDPSLTAGAEFEARQIIESAELAAKELIEAAEEESRAILDTAEEQAQDLLTLADETAGISREDLMASVQAQVDAILQEAHTEADSIKADAATILKNAVEAAEARTAEIVLREAELEQLAAMANEAESQAAERLASARDSAEALRREAQEFRDEAARKRDEAEALHAQSRVGAEEAHARLTERKEELMDSIADLAREAEAQKDEIASATGELTAIKQEIEAVRREIESEQREHVASVEADLSALESLRQEMSDLRSSTMADVEEMRAWLQETTETSEAMLLEAQDKATELIAAAQTEAARLETDAAAMLEDAVARRDASDTAVMEAEDPGQRTGDDGGTPERAQTVIPERDSLEAIRREALALLGHGAPNPFRPFHVDHEPAEASVGHDMGHDTSSHQPDD